MKKENNKIKLKNKWSDISIKDYEDIINILNSDLKDKEIYLLSILSGEDIDYFRGLGLVEYKKLLPILKFIEQPIKKNTESFITLNKTKYFITLNISLLNVGQYIDFQMYLNQDRTNTAQLLSCFIVPKDKTYGNGYDVKEVINDIYNYLNIEVMEGLLAFFTKGLRLSIQILNQSLEKEKKKIMKDKTITKESKEIMLKTIQSNSLQVGNL